MMSVAEYQYDIICISKGDAPPCHCNVFYFTKYNNSVKGNNKIEKQKKLVEK